MASISSTGIGSGLDINSIVTQMMSIERRPMNLIQQAKSGLDTKLSAMGSLQSRMSALLDASKALTSDPLWSQTLATSSNTAALTASATGNMTYGGTGQTKVDDRYGVQVNNLASRQTVMSEAFGDAMTGLRQGTLEIEMGRWGDPVDPSGFTPNANSNSLLINLADIKTGTSASLYEIRDAINGARAGVTATVINDASGFRMALSSTETGADNGFRVRVLTTSGDLFAISRLNYVNYGTYQPATAGMTQTQAAANAQATINGISIQSATNTISSDMLAGVADGLTLNLSRVTTEEVEVKVGPDRAGVKKAIEDFVKAYNDVNQYIGEQTAYDAQTKTGGALQGDPMVNTLRRKMREIIGYQKALERRSVSDIGISFTTNGALSINDTKLAEHVNNRLAFVRDLTAFDAARNGRDGVAVKMFNLATSVLGSEGMFANRTSRLKGQITQNERRQDSLDRRLTQTEERMRRQYQLLDASMSSLGGTSDYLAQQFSLLSGSSGNR